MHQIQFRLNLPLRHRWRSLQRSTDLQTKFYVLLLRKKRGRKEGKRERKGKR